MLLFQLPPARRALLALALGAATGLAGAGPLVRSAVGADAASIQGAVDQFRADLGTNNGVGPCAGACLPGTGRREVNWDAVPDAFSSGGGSAFPGNFFNLASGSPAGRVRGIEFSTAGAFEVSADASNPTGTAAEFGNHSSAHQVNFAAFSAERLFGLVGTNTMDVHFALPGSPTEAALVRGFGAVFTGVDVAGLTSMDFFDAAGALLLHLDLQAFAAESESEGSSSFSFAGASFDDAVVARVRLTVGSSGLEEAAPRLLGSAATALDFVAMDDFIFAEPTLAAATVDAPASLALASLALGTLGGLRRRDRRHHLA